MNDFHRTLCLCLSKVLRVMLKVLICKYALLVSLKLLSGDRESSGRFWTQEVTEERTTKV